MRVEYSTDVENLFTEFGAIAVTIENASPDEYYEVAYPRTPDWAEIAIAGLFPADTDINSIERSIQAKFGNELYCEITNLEDQDWERAWLAGYESVRVGEELWVCPSWLTPPKPEAINLIIDPGLAFGTGTHPTTVSCLKWLDANRPQGSRVVDYGCGSGILAIAALKLGASRAWGVDIDPRALDSSRENATRNDVSERYLACSPRDVPPKLRADLLFANILANVLIELRDTLLSLLDEKSVILLTGILCDQSDDVIRAFGTDLSFDKVEMDEWSLLIGFKG